MNAIRTLLTVSVLSLTAIAGWAQTPPTPPVDLQRLGPELKAIVDNNREALKALADARKALIERLQNATPTERELIRTQLQAIMKETQQTQRDLARAIRDAIKARRDQGKGNG